MFRLLITTFVVILFFCHSSASLAREIFIQNINIVSPPSLVLTLGAIQIVNGKIEKIFKGADAERTKPSAQAEVIDGRRRFVIPGLIDAHVHLGDVPGIPSQAVAAGEYAEIVREYRKQLPRSYLYYGFTSVVDLNVVDWSSIEIMKNSPAGPRVYHCGGGLVYANSYPMTFMPAPQRFNAFPNFVYDENEKGKVPSHINLREHSPEAAVKRVVQSGAICTKSFYEKGLNKKANLPSPKLATLQKITEESRKAGIPSFVHANSFAAHKIAVAADFTVLAHGLWRWEGHEGHDGIPKAISDILDVYASKQTGYIPTLRVLGGLESHADPSFLDKKELSEVFPQSIIKYYRSEEGQWFTRVLMEDWVESFKTKDLKMIRERMQQKAQNGKKALAYLASKGGFVLFGSDTPAAPTYGNPPGLNGFWELREMHAAGLSLGEVLSAATLRNARALHLEKDLGSLEEGKLADMVILRDNPLESIDAYGSIEAVVSKGILIPRTSLRVDDGKR